MCDRWYKTTKGLNIHKSRIHKLLIKIDEMRKVSTNSYDEYCLKTIDEIF